ncbi:hypothetical protein fugu_006892 [Takifugu bimaculatus]|uniref:Uncharacterized protein n=1 Tax=Takifugu bimaculatus TaxID=433685 RepID=A0A4Z2B2S2_9TELE|nr:hypothetical protein fugu_006892 [Takifugu bimaculatus]
MLNLGSKKKEASPRVERCAEQLPQLSNEMQLSIMNKVKSGELSIEDALDQARKGGTQVLQQQSQAEEEQEPTQHNFSVHKHNRYRWQKNGFFRSILRPKCCAASRKASSSASSPSHGSRAVTTGLDPDFPFPLKTIMIMSWRQLPWRTNTRSFSSSVRSSTGTYTASRRGAAQTQTRSLKRVSVKACCCSTAAAWRLSDG